ncbi:tripartite tricarboxylate transporter TctB family protein [Aureimonas frigidaquae]|uniref:DUF1468 domain-containing protein n=1 Tax=Aureimonas frigidaquae TaxID=424757 RepID=A0A0P0Z3J2_9HYPH|nr:tripartite tricarboxylate transporter TctB family protein [Aureimonas frigidaquae]BAT28680.1 hypothetical protein [Aureimonas frigidaquae]
MTSDRAFRIGEFLLGMAVLVLGVFVTVETIRMPVSFAGGGGGPKLFPFIIAAGLVAVGAWLLYEAYARHPSEEQRVELDFAPVAIIALGFLAMIFLLETLGWIVTGTMLFVAGARAFGSRRTALNILIGLGLTGLTYLVFDYGLSLDLPLGSLIENIVDPVEDEL